MAVSKWVQRFWPNRIYVRKKVAAFVIDETLIQIGNGVVLALVSHGAKQQNHKRVNSWVGNIDCIHHLKRA